MDEVRTDVERLEDQLDLFEERIGALMVAGLGRVRDELTVRIHRSELRKLVAIVLAFIADRALG